MPTLYPSWIEIPVTNLERALSFYRTVFELTDTPLYDEPPAQIALLLASDKTLRSPGVSLVQSQTHKPYDGGSQINFHLDSHSALDAAIIRVKACAGVVDTEIVDMGDGVRYITVLDCEGNRLALSSYEAPDGSGS